MMRLRTKLLLSFGTLTLVILLLGILNQVMLMRINKTIVSATGRLQHLDNQVKTSQVLVMNVHNEILNTLIFGKDNAYSRPKYLEAHAKAFYGAMEEISRYSPAHRAEIDSLAEQFRAFYIYSIDVLNKYDTETIRGHKDVLVKLRDLKDQFLLNMGRKVEFINQEFQHSLDQVKIQSDLSRSVLLPFIVLSILFALIFSFLITRSLSNPLRDLTQQIRKIESGDYQVKMEVKGKGELSRLMRAFNEMAEKLNKTMVELQQENLARRETEAILREREETLRATFEASDDAILVENVEGRITHFNSRFCELWRIPVELMASGDEMAIRQKGMSQVSDPDGFRKKIAEISRTTDRTRDLIHCKDGRVFERFSSPLMKDGKADGRVWTFKDISDQIRTTEALKKSEQNYRSIFNATSDAIFIHDLDTGEIVDVNESVSKMYQFTYQELLGKTVEQLSAGFSPYTLKEVGDKILSVIKSGQQKFDWLAKKKNGDLFWVEVSLRKGKIGDRDMLIAAVRDIGDRKRAEESLRESEERYRGIYENSTIGIYRSTPQGEILLANPALVNMMGYQSEEELKKEKISEGHYLENYSRKDFLNAFKNASEIHGLESAWIRKDGRELYVRESARAVRDKNGNILYFEGTIEDITEWKNAEIELNKLRVLLGNIVDSMPSILIGVDPHGNITQWNRQAEVLTGIPAQDAVGVSLDKAMPRMRKELDRVKEAIKSRSTQYDAKIAEEINGEIRFSDITVYPLIANGVEGAVIRIDDVTERVRIEEMMIQSEKMLTVGGLAAGMAHEINNPLAGMLQNAQVLLNRLSNPLPKNVATARQLGTDMETISRFMRERDIIKMLELILSTGKRAAKIVENMLSFSRKSDSGMIASDMGQLLHKTVELASNDYDLKKRYDFRTIQINYEIAEKLPKVPCESVKIQQVVLNLLKNAAQAMFGLKRKPVITLRAYTEQDMACIEVEDNGAGMDEDTRKRIFEPFFTTKAVGEGTGLGLSVSYFIVSENHKGSMNVESVPGQGSKFIIKLPLKYN